MNDAEGAFGLWASSKGWVVTKRGWPDFLCRRGAELMAVEVKDRDDWLSAEQRSALIDLHAAGIPTYIWTPLEGLSAYPQRHDKTLADQAAIAWELEQARERVETLERDLEIARTQLVPMAFQLQQTHDTASKKLSAAGNDLEVLARFIEGLPNVPPDVQRVAKRWTQGAWRRWRLTRLPLDKSA